MVDSSDDPTAMVLKASSASIAVCTLLYRSSQRYSDKWFKAYRKLPEPDQRDWDSRVTSTVHAVVVTLLALYSILGTETFTASSPVANIPAIFRTSPLTSTTIAFSLGYFVYDSVLCVLHYPVMGGGQMLMHHVVGLMSVLTALHLRTGHLYVLIMLATELTTPAINLRWWLDKSGMKDTSLYFWNGMTIFVTWFLGRVVLFFPFGWHVLRHWPLVMDMPPSALALLVGVPIVLFVLNVMWFWKIAKGALKLIVAEQPSQAHHAGSPTKRATKTARVVAKASSQRASD